MLLFPRPVVHLLSLNLLMKRITLFLLTLSVCIFQSNASTAQAVNTADSLALVDLYNSTGGPNWVNHTNWLTASPASTWFGISLNGSNRIGSIFLPNNNLVGSLPSSIGNLTVPFFLIDVNYNRLSGPLPASMVNFNYGVMFLSHNQFSGALPDFPQSSLQFLDISYNNFTFADLEPFDEINPLHLIAAVTPQADLPLIQNNSTLSIAAGGTVAYNTYTWYENGTVVATKIGDSTYVSTGPGTYSVTVTNSHALNLTLFSIQNLNTQDSLALIDLYNSTAGNGWVINNGWATNIPAASWAGVVARFGKVSELNLTANNLSGAIPSSIGNLIAPSKIDFSVNQLSGSIPSAFGNLQSLLTLNLDSNRLTGNIPSTLGALNNVTTLDLSINQLTGSIPSSLGNLSTLRNLNLGNNQLSGNIPAELGKLANCTNILLSNNLLSDTIPASIGNCTNLLQLALDHNQLTGQIPPSIARLQNLGGLILSYNHLTGTIPDSISYIPSLFDIYVDNNQLTGSLPDSLSKDPNVRQIHAQNNNLSGKINTNLAALPISVFYLFGNKYNFSAFPINLSGTPDSFIVYPQQNILLIRTQSTLTVTAGGNVAHNTYTLFKDGGTIATQTSDSAFAVTALGNYNIVTTNTDVPGLTLYSDTLKLGLVLPDSTLTVQQSISGSGAVDVDTSIFRLATLTPASDANGVSGNVTVSETIDNQVSSYNGQPYAQRHYDITPASNASIAEATVALYFTQQDFDAFNTYVTSNGLPIPLLPTNGVDNGNVRITQYHGTYSGTANPANYSQGSTIIQPTVSWDATADWWTVSFSVTGFSGFFLGSGSVPLPLTLLKFSGIRKNSSDYLTWSTSNEVNTSNFSVERSADSLSFNAIGQVKASSSTGEHDYTFTDASPYKGNNFYRLKMIDLDGHFTYSPIVLISQSTANALMSIYPNPAKESATILFTAGIAEQYLIQVTDAAGNPIRRLSGTSFVGLNQAAINLYSLAAGTYFVTIFDQEYGKRELILNKQ
jgi:hypothetical protein